MAGPLPERQSDLRWELIDAGIRDRRVLDAIERIPRYEFVRFDFRPQTYDLDLEIPMRHGQWMNRVEQEALLAQELRLSGPERLLEVGTGSGYGTVVLADLCAHVTTIERIADLIPLAYYHSRGRANIDYRAGDGFVGCPEHAPFDRIVLSGAAPGVPRSLFEQLAPRGVLLAPVGSQAPQILKRVAKDADGTARVEDVGPGRFRPLVVPEGFRDYLG